MLSLKNWDTGQFLIKDIHFNCCGKKSKNKKKHNPTYTSAHAAVIMISDI